MLTSQIKFKDFPLDFLQEIQQLLEPTMACILKVSSNNGKLQQSGSGVFVSYKGRHGILTAGHVVKAIEREDFVLLPVKTGSAPVKLEISNLQLKYDYLAPSDEGPDIGYIELAPSDATAIASRMRFVSLERQMRMYNDALPDWGEGIWSDAGFPAIDGQYEYKDSVHTQRIVGMVSVGNSKWAFESDNYDYYDSDVIYTDTNNLPKNFGGISGGGLWQTTVGKNRLGEFSILQSYLSGIVFWQSVIENDKRYLRSHGRRSLYERAIVELVSPK